MSWEVGITVISLIISIGINVVQAIWTREMRKVFKARMQGSYRSFAHAIYSATELRGHTQLLSKEPKDISFAAIRAMNILTGDLNGYVLGAAEELRGFSEEYLKLSFPSWREIISEFDSKKQAAS